MHIKQQQLLSLIEKDENFGSYSLRQIATMIGAEGKPQTAKHHLQKLEKDGLINLNLEEGIIKLVKRGHAKATLSPIYYLPVVGSVNCGPAAIFAEENVSQYLKISSSLLPRNKKSLYALIAEGSSMNKAEVEEGKTIEDGDFILVDSEYKSFRNKDIVVAIIDGLATVKRYREDKKNERIVLEPDSTENYLPIYIHEGDDFLLSGKVVGIIKK